MLSLFSFVRLCDPMDYSPPGSSVYGILQARILEWVVTPSSRGPSPPRDGNCGSCNSCITGGFFTAEPLRKPKLTCISYILGFPSGSAVKNLPANAGDLGLIPAWEDPWRRKCNIFSAVPSVRVERKGSMFSYTFLSSKFPKFSPNTLSPPLLKITTNHVFAHKFSNIGTNR